MSSSAGRELLLGIIAVQLDFISRDQLVAAVQSWVRNKTRPISEFLRTEHGLDEETLALLNGLAGKRLLNHGGDTERSLAALSSLDPETRRQLGAIADADVQATVTTVGATARIARDTAGSPPVGAGARYRILRPHARGGLGEVFVAEDLELGRRVALKEIQPQFADDESSRSRFVLEAEVTGGLEHPGIVPVYGLGTYADGRPFYAMRFVQGENLKHAIVKFHAGDPQFESLAFRELLGRFIDVCNAIAYAHSRGVLHRDLKPGNVMLGRFGETLVVDWGLAKIESQREKPAVDSALEPEGTLTPPTSGKSSGTVLGAAIGTPAYMPPEQAAGRPEDLGPASDVYSLGATLYELLTGRAPFSGQSDEVLPKVRDGDFPQPRAVNSAVPPALAAVCLKAMAKNPADRFPTALALARDLERWLADEPVSAWNEPVGLRVRRWLKRHRMAMAAASALLATAAVAGIIGVVVVAGERNEKDRALTSALTARRQTREALNTMTDDAIERLFARKPQLGPEEKAFLQKVELQYQRLGAPADGEPSESFDDRVSRADGFFRIGCVREALGDFAGAEANYRTAIGQYVPIVAERPAENSLRWNLALTQINLGALLFRRSNGAGAEQVWREAIENLNVLSARVSDNRKHRAKIADLRNNLGAVCGELNRPAESEAHYRAALQTLAELLGAEPANAGYRESLGATHNNLAVFLTYSKRPAEAEDEFRATRDLFAELASQEPRPEYRLRLATAHNNLGAQLRVNRKPSEAEAEHRAAVQLAERLVAEFPGAPDYRVGLADSLNNLGLVLIDAGRDREAETAYAEALALRKRLAAAYPESAEFTSNLAATLVNLSELDRKRGDPGAALARLAEAQPLWQAALKAVPDSPDYRFGYRESLRATVAALVDRRFYAEANAKVEAILALGYDAAADAQCAAFALAYAAMKAGEDDRLTTEERRKRADELARRSVILLGQALANGLQNVRPLLDEPDLKSVRARDDFADLLWQWADVAMEANPG